jgi:hypothetical protein
MKPIRCGNSNSSPYVRKHLPNILVPKDSLAVDLGAGNLRNTKFAQSLGWNVLPIDAAGDNGSVKVDLGKEPIPCLDHSVDLFLSNYVMCFMNENECDHLISEIHRTARSSAHIIVEMFQAKKAFPYNVQAMCKKLGWHVIIVSKDRFIAQKLYDNINLGE